MKKTLVLPGWMTSLKLYKNNVNDFNINIGKLKNISFDGDYVVGISIGSLEVLKNIEHLKGKVILINPPLPKRNILIWFVQWLKYITSGLFIERQKFTINPIRWCIEIINCIILLNIDFSEKLKLFPRDRIVVIKSKNDNFFCDSRAVNFLHSLNIDVVEIEGGHNWNEKTEEEMNSLIDFV